MRALVGNVVFGFDKEVAHWVAARIPGFEVGPQCTALGVVHKKKLVAGAVFDRWNGVHIETAIAADLSSRARWASRTTLKTLFNYPFLQLGCKAMTVGVPATNLESLNLATKLGFEVEALVKFAAHDGSSLIVLKMFKENCRWIGDNNGKKGRQRTSSTGSIQDSSG